MSIWRIMALLATANLVVFAIDGQLAQRNIGVTADEHELARVRGGAGCFYQNWTSCSQSGGCVDCGYPSRFGVPNSCPNANTTQRNSRLFGSLLGDRGSYYVCSSSTAGLTECGPPTQYSCGQDELCDSTCTGGSPINSIQPSKAKCLVIATENALESETLPSGDYCFVS